MTQAAESFDCRRCNGSFSGQDPDSAGWCKACRAKLVKQAALASVPYEKLCPGNAALDRLQEAFR